MLWKIYLAYNKSVHNSKSTTWSTDVMFTYCSGTTVNSKYIRGLKENDMVKPTWPFLFTNALSRCLPILTKQRHCYAVFVGFTYVFGYLYIKYCIHSSCISAFLSFVVWFVNGNLKTPSSLGLSGMLKQLS